MSLKRFKAFVRDAFQTAREDLERVIDQTVAGSAAKGSLGSGATVKQMASTYADLAIDVVDRCRAAAGGSVPRQAHLRAVLPGEVDRLSAVVTDSLDRLGHFAHVDEAVRELMAEQTERVMRDRTPPAEPAAPINQAKAQIGPMITTVVATIAAGLMVAWLAFRLGWVG